MNNISIKGARTNNLKNISLDIPKNKLVVVTGLSGSGKSSLAFDTIYSEGQRRYVESLSSYARQFLGVMDKPDVDSITGLSPAISIDQKGSNSNPRSTVGTITEIYDYLRLLFAKAGHPHSPVSGNRLQSQTIQQIVDKILKMPFEKKQDVKILILAPVVKNRKGTYEELFNRLLRQGFLRVRVDRQIYSLEEEIQLDRFVLHNIEVVVDRLVITKDSMNKKKRITDSIELALRLGDKEIYLHLPEESIDVFFSEKLVDPETGESFPKIAPSTFSFNSPYGACSTCVGLGVINEVNPKEIYNPNLSIAEGGIFPYSRMVNNPNSWNMQLLKGVGEYEGFSLKDRLGSLSDKQLSIILHGSDKTYKINYTREDGSKMNINIKYEGVIPNLKRRYQETNSDFIKREIEEYMTESVCPSCLGKRLSKTALSVTIKNKNIIEVGNLQLEELKKWLNSLINKKTEATIENDLLTKEEQDIAKIIIKDAIQRIDFLIAVGLNYLTINRKANSLSGGESQRIRLASQIGAGLSGVIYILDEPSIGLHQRDNSKLLKTLNDLKNLGNSIIVVEHDKDTMFAADHIIDMGSGAGDNGGEIIAMGTVKDIIQNEKSITGKYLSGEKTINRDVINKEIKKISESEIFKVFKNNKNNNNKFILLKGAKGNNLKNVDLKIPLNKFVAITGVSGSGKSTLINDTLSKILHKHFHSAKSIPLEYESVEGLENIDKVITVDQSPIGRTPRSNPATYTGVFTAIRELFAKTKEAKIRGYNSGRFSFNIHGGRCEACKGDGIKKIEMQFLPDVYVKCSECEGTRYNRETLEIDYKGKNISDVLNMTVDHAVEFFNNITSIKTKLQTLQLVGLGYIKLGQSSTTLSGGEAQRIKLATELSKRSTGKTLYILDEPTTGLHFEDLKKLLIILHCLVNKGNTVLVIEHNLDLIKTADHIIDLGPEGGDKGGEIIAQGTPYEVSQTEKSYTGQWLKKELNPND